MVGLGGIQFCKLLVLSKLENCTAAAWLRPFFRAACIAHTRGCWLRIHRAAKNSKDSHESSKPSPPGITEKDRSVAMQHVEYSGGEQKKISREEEERRKTSFEWIIFAGLGCSGMLPGK